jgi:excisionase family DNA binding protein
VGPDQGLERVGSILARYLQPSGRAQDSVCGSDSAMAQGDLLKVADVQEVLGIGRSKVYELIARNELSVLRIGRLIRVPRWALKEWVEAQTTTGRPPTDSEAA